jgi:hypothetical protein
VQKEFDLEAVTQELDKEFSQGEVTEDEVTESEAQAQEDTPDEVQEGENESSEGEVEEVLIDPELHKRNEAFKKLRVERDEMAKSDKFLSDLAAQYNMTKQELIQKYTDELHKKQAEEQGIDPKQYKKMQEMEQKIQQIEEEKQKEVFNLRANQLAERYRLSDKEMMSLFQYAGQFNIDVIQNPDLLDFVYRAVYYENAIEQGRQAQLETTKKRKATSTGKTGTTGRQFETTEEDMQSEIDAFLKEQGILKQK